MDGVFRKRSVAFYIYYTFLLFFFLYQANLSFLGLPSQLHSSRLSVILLVVSASIIVLKNNNRGRFSVFSMSSVITTLRLFVFLLFYGLIISLLIGFGEGDNIVVTLLNYFILAIPSFWAFSKIFHTADEFIKILFYVGVIQSVFVLLSVLSPSFATALYLTVNVSDNIDYQFADLLDNYAGGIGCITSSGVVRYSTGMAACVYLYLKKKSPVYLLCFTFMSVIAAMIARTGLLYVITGVIFIMVGSLKSRSFLKVVLAIGIVGILSINLLTDERYKDFFHDRYARFEILKDDKGKSFFENYFHGEDTRVPPLNFETFFGTSILSGESGNGYVVNVDGGPLRLYSAVGVLMCLVFYWVFFKVMLKTAKYTYNQELKLFLILLMICFVIAELKEQFLLLPWPTVFFYILAYLNDGTLTRPQFGRVEIL